MLSQIDKNKQEFPNSNFRNRKNFFDQKGYRSSCGNLQKKVKSLQIGTARKFKWFRFNWIWHPVWSSKSEKGSKIATFERLEAKMEVKDD